MEVSEQSRHELHQKLEEVLGREAAGTLMAHLPSGGSDRVATKADLELLELRLGGRLDLFEGRVGRQLGEVYKELSAHTRTVVYANLAAVMTTGFLAFAAARL
ncbi:MAG: hypothetical protein M3Q48_12235 [Actinomycetota bacterium]|nr:hypothetical protein [Actinomycetota bacterium]